MELIKLIESIQKTYKAVRTVEDKFENIGLESNGIFDEVIESIENSFKELVPHAYGWLEEHTVDCSPHAILLVEKEEFEGQIKSISFSREYIMELADGSKIDLKNFGKE